MADSWNQGTKHDSEPRITSQILHEEGEDAASVIIAGQLNLGLLLVLRLAKEHGATEADVFRKAGDILRDMLPKLPE